MPNVSSTSSRSTAGALSCCARSPVATRDCAAWSGCSGPLEQLDAYAELHTETLAAAKAGDVERGAAAVQAFWGNLAAAVDDVPLEEIAP